LISWWNYKEGKFLDFDGAPPVETLKDYMPQLPPAFCMYDCLVQLGNSEMNALKEVLLACVGGKQSNKKEND
jgi:hypothetical protein